MNAEAILYGIKVGNEKGFLYNNIAVAEKYRKNKKGHSNVSVGYW